jgi:ribonuclease G
LNQLTIIASEFTQIAISHDAQHIHRTILEQKKQGSLLNQIFAARVVNVVESLDGVFLDIGHSQNAFMPRKALCYALGIRDSNTRREPLDKLVKRNHMILAQVSREPFQTKGALLSGDISLEGKYFVLLPRGKGIRYSRKLRETPLPKSSISFIESYDLKQMGIIVRSRTTSSTSQEALKCDLEFLFNQWQAIERAFKLTSTIKKLYDATQFTDEIYRQLFDETITEIHCNDSEIKEALIGLGINKKLFHAAIFDYNHAKTMLDRLKSLLTSHQFKTPNGMGYSIDELEAFTIIDVNSSKRVSDQNKNEMAVVVNREIAMHIQNTLLKREISGVIIIDFIQMTDADSKALFLTLKESTFTPEDDFTLHGFTKLGLLEMTRKRLKPSLLEQLSFNFYERDLHFLDLLMIDIELQRLSQHTNTTSVSLVLNEPLYIFLKQQHMPSKISLQLQKQKSQLLPYQIVHKPS